MSFVYFPMAAALPLRGYGKSCTSGANSASASTVASPRRTYLRVPRSRNTTIEGQYPTSSNLALSVHEIHPEVAENPCGVNGTTREVRMKVITAATCSLALGVLCLSLAPMVSAADKPSALHHQDIQKVQQSLSDKGFYHGRADGVLGSRTRESIREYQRSASLPVTGRLDAETAGKLGVGPESIGGSFKGAGQEVGQGGQELGHEMKQGKPVAGGKEFGLGVGRAAQKVASGVKKAATTDSDRGDREKK